MILEHSIPFLIDTFHNIGQSMTFWEPLQLTAAKHAANRAVLCTKATWRPSNASRSPYMCRRILFETIALQAYVAWALLHSWETSISSSPRHFSIGPFNLAVRLQTRHCVSGHFSDIALRRRLAQLDSFCQSCNTIDPFGTTERSLSWQDGSVVDQGVGALDNIPIACFDVINSAPCRLFHFKTTVSFQVIATPAQETPMMSKINFGRH